MDYLILLYVLIAILNFIWLSIVSPGPWEKSAPDRDTVRGAKAR